VVLPNADRAELHWNGQRIGIYDYATKTFRRVNTDGQMSGPVPLPWSSTAKRDEGESAAKLRAAYLAKSQSESETPSMPLTPYAMGGGVTGLILVMRVFFLFIRR
jgi:hypothetical protein